MRSSTVVLASLLAVACEKKAADATLDAGPVVTTPLGFRVDETKLEEVTRLALGVAGESSLRVRVSTVPERCEDFTHGDPVIPAGETAVDFWVAPMVQPDGSRRWGFHSAYVTRPNRHASIVRAALLDDVTSSKEEIVVHGFDIRLHEPFGLVAYEGDLTAKICPRTPRREPLLPQPDLTLKVAGQTVGVTGATLSNTDGQLFLKLTQAPHDCSTLRWEGYDVVLDLAARGEPPVLSFGSLSGTAFEGGRAGREGADKATFHVGASLEPEEGASRIRRVELEVSLVLEGIPVSASGTVRALDCR
jgi:hypothetical protein